MRCTANYEVVSSVWRTIQYTKPQKRGKHIKLIFENLKPIRVESSQARSMMKYIRVTNISDTKIGNPHRN